LVAGLYGFMGVLEFIRSRVLSRVGSQLDDDLNPRTFSIWVTEGVSGLQKASQPLHDLKNLRQFLAGSGPLALFDMPWVPIYLGVIFLFHWTLGLVATVGAVTILAVALANELLTRKPLSEANRSQLNSSSFAELFRRNAEAVLALGMRRHVQSRWLDLQSKATSEHRQASDRSSAFSSFSKSFRRFLQSAILAAGAVLAIKQIISPGMMIAASIIMGRALSPIDLAIGQWKGFISARLAWRRRDRTS
jgi:ABC-type protease/lipase transport system fused ATPase/permease subunit